MPDGIERLKRLAAHMWRHFKEDRCFEEAASLGYTSLLSLVPLLAVVFGVATAFPVFDRWAEDVQSFIFENFVPAAGAQVEAYVSGFLDSVGRLTLPGTFMLIISALLLMMRIEHAFNRIWRVPAQRGLIGRIVMYWAVLTLGPITLGAATALSAQPLFEWLGGNQGSSRAWHSSSVFLLTWLAFCLVFVLVPNRRVRFLHAALGAALSTALFSLAKIGFVWFVARASFNVIYGTLATIPIFLLWLYLAWTVTLLGASLAASLTTFMDRGGDWRWPWEWEFLLAYRLIGHLWMAQNAGKTLSIEDLTRAEPGVSGRVLQRMLEDFIGAGLVTQDQQSNWLLVRDLDRFTVLDLYRAGRFHLPVGRQLEVPTTSDWDAAFLRLLRSGGPDLQRSLKSLYTEQQA
jgi:membrane protein